jgi:hypothetical protein
MGITHLSGLDVAGVPTMGMAGIPIPSNGEVKFVSPSGIDGNTGAYDSPYSTIQYAIDQSAPGGVIVVSEGAYDEAVTIARDGGRLGTGLAGLTIVGLGGRGATFVETSTTNATALTNDCDDITIVNVGFAGDGTGAGVINTGSRLRMYGCKLEGGAVAIQFTLGTVAQDAAGTKGNGADCLLEDCETAWTTRGILLTCTDYGAVTETFISNCYHHDHSAAAIDESVGSGGSAAVLFQGLRINNCIFNDLEDGTAPTAFILLNDNNANAGIVTQCAFPSAINSGKNLVSTALHWVSNYHTGGISTAQPS